MKGNSLKSRKREFGKVFFAKNKKYFFFKFLCIARNMFLLAIPVIFETTGSKTLPV